MKPSNSRFIPEFEPIRGLAALTVALMHSFYILQANGGDAGAIALAKTVFNGYAAVTTFFLLSGIVLGLALDRYSGTFLAKWRQFLILRTFRIYPMILVVTAAICIYLLFFRESQSFPMATQWFSRYYLRELGWHEALKNFLLISVSLNPVAWTLMVEMAVAVLFPLLHFISRRSGALANAVAFTILVALAFLAPRIKELAPDNLLFTPFCNLVLPHAYKFYIGLLLPAYMSTNVIGRISAVAVPYFALSVLVLVLARPIGNWLGASGTLTVLVESLAAACVLAPFCVSAGPRIGSALFDLKMIRWLGRVSYSFYIWHFIVLYVIATLLLNYVAEDLLGARPFLFSVFMAISSVTLTGIIANYSYRLVEVRFVEYRTPIRPRSACAARGCYERVTAPTNSRLLNSLKNASRHGTRYTTREQAITDMFDCIEVFHNRRRRPSKLGYHSPIQFLQNWITTQHEQKMAA